MVKTQRKSSTFDEEFTLRTNSIENAPFEMWVFIVLISLLFFIIAYILYI